VQPKWAHSQKVGHSVLSPERAATYQPRATPWVDDRFGFSPERALHMQTIKEKNVTPFQGYIVGYFLPRALPWAGMLPPFQG